MDVLRGHALHQKDQVAVSCLSDEGAVVRTVTYSELDRQARSIAAWLQQRDLVGKRVILVYAHSREFLPAFLGCLYAGAVAVPTHIPRCLRYLDRLQAIRADSNSRAVLTAAETLESCRQAFPAQDEDMAWLATDSLDDGSANWATPRIDLSTLAFLQYTSGSTASPSGVAVRHANLTHNLKLSHRTWDSDSGSVVLSWLPFFHDMGLIGAMLGALFVGCPLFLMSPASFMQRPLRWLQAITRYRATHSGAPNFAFDHCVRSVSPEERQSLDLSSWRVAWNGAEPLQSATLERFQVAFASCGFRIAAHSPCYGLAEATLMVSGSPCGKRAVHRLVDREALGRHRFVSAAGQPGSRAISLVSSGRVGADLKVLIVHPETRQVCSPEEVGEIWVAGPSVAAGYWNQPEKTAETFAAQTADGAGPFLRTGDLGCLWQGELFVVGRVKELIIIRGRNYYPTDLERTAWTSHPALQEHGGAAFCVSAADQTERVVLVHEVRRERLRSLEPAEVFAAIRGAVAAQHEVGVGAMVLLKPGQLPRTSSGKIRRLACATAFLRGDLECLAQWQETSPESPEFHLSLDENLAAALREASLGQRERLLTEWVQRVVQQILGMPTLPGPDLLVEMGMDSLQAVTLRGRLEAGIGRPVPGTLALERATIAEVVTSLSRELDKPLLPAPQPEQRKYLPRNLSGIESIVWGGGRLTVNAVGIVRVRGVFTEAALVEAIAVVQARHPLLSVRIRLDEDGYPCFVPDTALRLPLRVVERQFEHHWEHEVARELGTPFDGLTGVLSRIVCLRSHAVSELVFCCHHAVADGLSVRNALRDLLEAMGRPGTHFAPLPERPSIETWIPTELAAIVAAMPPFTPPAHVQEGYDAPLGHRPNLRVLSCLLQEEDTSALLTCAGVEQASVHGAFCAASLLAHNDLYGYRPRRTVSCPISLRGRFGIPNENDFGLYMALSEVTADCSERGDVWVMARAITAALDQRAADPMLLLPIAALRSQVAVMPYAQAVELSLAGIGNISYDLSVTNLGRLESPDTFGGLQVEEVFGAVLGPDAEKVVAVCMTRRRISLTMTFNERVLPEAMARRLVDAALERLVVRGGMVAGSPSGN